MSFVGSTGHVSPLTGFVSVTVLKSIDVNAANGCPPACVNGEPPGLAVTCASNESTPKSGGVAVILVESTVDASAAPPPETSNVLVSVPVAEGSTLALMVTALVRQHGKPGSRTSFIVHVTVDAPGTSVEQSHAGKPVFSADSAVRPAGSVPSMVNGLPSVGGAMTPPAPMWSPTFATVTK